jgi:hypothetical protein
MEVYFLLAVGQPQNQVFTIVFERVAPPRVCNLERVSQPCRATKTAPSTYAFFEFHQQNFEFATLPIASWLSASNIDPLPHTSPFRLLTIVLAEDGCQAVGKSSRCSFTS